MQLELMEDAHINNKRCMYIVLVFSYSKDISKGSVFTFLDVILIMLCKLMDVWAKSKR